MNLRLKHHGPLQHVNGTAIANHGQPCVHRVVDLTNIQVYRLVPHSISPFSLNGRGKPLPDSFLSQCSYDRENDSSNQAVRLLVTKSWYDRNEATTASQVFPPRKPRKP